jgi:hypothetical protein
MGQSVVASHRVSFLLWMMFSRSPISVRNLGMRSNCGLNVESWIVADSGRLMLGTGAQ